LLIPPSRSIRTEVTDAVVGGIRERGSEAVGLLIVGAARIATAVMALIVLVVASKLVGIEISAVRFAVMALFSGLVSWLITPPRH
jgi:hypothetical protein